MGVWTARVNSQGGRPLRLLKVDPAVASVEVLLAEDAGSPSLTAAEFASRFSLAAAWNGGYFDAEGKAMGLLVSKGRTRSPLRRADWGVFYLDETGPHIVHTRDYREEEGVTAALQCGPRLVVDGKATVLKPQEAVRTAIAVVENSQMLVVVSEEFSTLTFEDLAATLISLGARDALNLDGGPSSQLWARGPGELTVDQPGGTPVPVSLGVMAAPLPEPPSPGCLP